MPIKIELEKNLEDRCVAKVEARGGLALKLAPVGTRGFPDRTILMPGRRAHGDYYPEIRPRVWFCEFKRARLGKVSAQQSRWRVLLFQLGFGFYTIDTDEQFDAAMERELNR